MKAVFRPPPGVCSYTSYHLCFLGGLELLRVRLWEPSESTVLVETAAAGESVGLPRRTLRVSPGVSGFDASPYSLLAVSPPRVTSLLSCASVSLTCRLGTTC